MQGSRSQWTKVDYAHGQGSVPIPRFMAGFCASADRLFLIAGLSATGTSALSPRLSAPLKKLQLIQYVFRR